RRANGDTQHKARFLPSRMELQHLAQTFERGAIILGRRLSPHDPSLHYWYAGKSTAHFALKQYEEAIEWARRGIAIDQTFRQPHPMLIAALGWTGRQAEAIQRYLALFPTGPRTIAAWQALKARKTDSDTDPHVLEFWDRLIEGLRKARLP